MCVSDRQWWNGVQQNPKPSDCDRANYRGIYAGISAAIAQMIQLRFFFVSPFSQFILYYVSFL